MSPIVLSIFTHILIPMTPIAGIHDFFQNVINNPFENMMPLIILAGVCVGIVSGIIYMVRRHLEKKRMAEF